MKRSINLYWPVYRTLENDILKLSHAIMFDDDQKRVYSAEIAGLLLRCGCEVEALALAICDKAGIIIKDKKNKVIKQPSFPSDVRSEVNDLFMINQKQVLIGAQSFYFSEITITPFAKESFDQWWVAYNNVKHNRTLNYKHASVWNLVQALAAAFLLNVYFQYEPFPSKTSKSGYVPYQVDEDEIIFTSDGSEAFPNPPLTIGFDAGFGSTIFQAAYAKEFCHDQYYYPFGEVESCVFIEKNSLVLLNR